jgi:hypothetical protein
MYKGAAHIRTQEDPMRASCRLTALLMTALAACTSAGPGSKPSTWADYHAGRHRLQGLRELLPLRCADC